MSSPDKRAIPLSANAPHISVVVCTYNRAKYLPGCLDSLVSQTLDSSKYEVIVVNNNSTDCTQEIVEKYAAEHINFRMIVEDSQGLSHARNSGWKEAVGLYVAFLDDDAIACPTWLERILWSFENIMPEPACVGGEINLMWEAPRPDWLGDEILSNLGRLYHSSVPCYLEQEFLFGGNMAVCKTFLQEIGGFCSQLGRGASDLLGNEELLLQQQLRRNGLLIYYNPDVLVTHIVNKSRICKKWFMKRNFWQGVSAANLESITNITTLPYCLYRMIRIGLKTIYHCFMFVFTKNIRNRFHAQCIIAENLGYIKGLINHSMGVS